MVLHQGDFGYGWRKRHVNGQSTGTIRSTQLSGRISPTLSSVGNHDLASWPVYQQLLQERLDRVAGASCIGNLGLWHRVIMEVYFSSCLAPEPMGFTETEHADYLKEQFGVRRFNLERLLMAQEPESNASRQQVQRSRLEAV